MTRRIFQDNRARFDRYSLAFRLFLAVLRIHDRRARCERSCLSFARVRLISNGCVACVPADCELQEFFIIFVIVKIFKRGSSLDSFPFFIKAGCALEKKLRCAPMSL